MEEGREGSGVWQRSHRSLTTGLVLTVSLTAFEALAVATVMPMTARALAGGDLGGYGWVFSAFLLASLVGIPVSGALADRRGPSLPFLAGCGLFAAGLLVSGLAPSMSCLIAGRVVQGFGAGALSSIAYLAVARGYEARDQPRMLALLASAWVVPGLVGPALAALVAESLGWRAVFLCLVPLTLAGAALSLRAMRSLAPEAPASSRPAGPPVTSAVLLAAGCAAALAAPTLSGPATGSAAGLAGIAIAGSALRRLVPDGTLRAMPGAPAALAAKALVTVAFFGAEAFLPLSLTIVCGQSMTVAGLILTTGTVSWTLGTWTQERIAGRADGGSVVRAGLGLVLAGIAAVAWLPEVAWPLPLAAAGWTAAGLGIGLCYPAATLIVFDGGRSGEEGAAASALQLANVLGSALGTGAGGLALGFALGHGAGHATAITIVDVLMLAAAVAGLAAAWRIPGSTAAGIRKPGPHPQNA